MLKYAEEQMGFGRGDGCPVVVIFRSLRYQDRGRNITTKCNMVNVQFIHLNKRSRSFPVCN